MESAYTWHALTPRLALCALFFLALAVLVGPQASASPIISIGNGGDTSWTAALPNIRVAGTGGSPGPVDPDSASFQFYQDAIGQNMFGTPVQQVLAANNVQLFADVPVSDASFGGSEQFDSLVMSWENNPGDDVLNVAAWDYVYDVDPDLTGLHIKLSILPPPGVWDFSLELFDVNGSSIGWFGVPPSTTWTSVVIDPSIQAPQGPFTAFHTGANPLGVFDVTQVAFLRLNESSQTGVAFGTFPVTGGPIIPPGQPWNAWNHLRVVPEPISLWLVALGLAGLAVVRGCPTRSR